MSKQASKHPKRKSQPSKSKILEAITPEDAVMILRHLAENDAELAKRMQDVAMELFSSVDVDDIASQVQMELESLNVEDVWDRSGSTSQGYLDPGDASWEMFEETLEPFEEQLNKYKDLSMDTEAKLLCMGMLKGIYDFGNESNTEYKDWAVDAPGEFFMIVLDDWRNWTKKRKELAEMDEFIEKHCPMWVFRRKKRG